MALHEVQLKGYSVRPGNLSLGTFDSYGIEQLHVTLDDTWSGLAVTATFNPPKGEPVEIRVPENGLIDVPAEATANEGTGAIVYCGVANGVQLITKTQGYNVITHGNVGGTEPFNPSESLATQVLQAALNAEKNSAEANTAAQSAQTAAENATAAAQASAESASKAAAEAAAAKPYAESAKASAEAARYSENQAQQSSAEANTAKNAAQNAQAGAESSATAAEKSAKEAAASKAAAANSSAAAKTSEDAAAKSAADADSTANSIKESMTQIAALQKRQNVLVGSEIGNPASCDDAFAAPLCGLTVYGKSTQDGTPTPDAPVPIVSAGDGGTIVLTLGDGDGKTQTLTLPTPNGLPGIPVASGGNYTDPQGQNWVCDEVDLERGVKVQRVNAVDLSTCVITGTTNLATTKRLAIRLPLKGKDYQVKALCNRLPYLVSFTSDTIHFYVDTNHAQVFIPIGAKNPEEGEYILFYVLDAPIETPLTPAEIAAYKAITAYAPDTVVQASDGAGIKLGYQRDVNITIKKLEDAIASVTAT